MNLLHVASFLEHFSHHVNNPQLCNTSKVL
jgi:hypothetical protein